MGPQVREQSDIFLGLADPGEMKRETEGITDVTWDIMITHCPALRAGLCSQMITVDKQTGGGNRLKRVKL